MSWQQVSAMGAGNVGGGGPGGQGPSGIGAQDLGSIPGSNQHTSNATEYTLQGVMRFLQTEWHRHERDRNAWEIERLEMRGRIAALEGSARRADATQKALKRYVTILEKKVKDQSEKLKSASITDGAGVPANQAPVADRATWMAERLKPSTERSKEVAVELEGLVGERFQEDEERDNLRLFLDQCQAEFTYLMVTPANPVPPRESPPLPSMDDHRVGDAFGVSGAMSSLDAAFPSLRMNQNMTQNAARDAAARGQANVNHQAPAMQRRSSSGFTRDGHEPQSAPMVRSGEGPSVVYSNAADWQAPIGGDVGVAMTNRMSMPPGPMSAHADGLPHHTTAEETMATLEPPNSDAWDFDEGAFESQMPQAQARRSLSSQRPDTDVFPTADNPSKSPSRGRNTHGRRNGSNSRRRSADLELSSHPSPSKSDGTFKLRFGLRGHLNTVRTVIFSGGGSPGEPEICTADDDGMIKRFHMPRDHTGHLNTNTSDLDVPADFTHRGHHGAVLCLTSWSPSPSFNTGGRAQGDGWIFSGGQDTSVRVWERGRVDPKATLDGHTDAVWAICVLPTTLGAVYGQSNPHGTPERILLVSGAADGAIKIWAVSAPPQLVPPQPAPSGRRATGGGRVRGNSMSSGSQFPNSPQPNLSPSIPFYSTLVHDIRRANGSKASPTCIAPLSSNGENFVVSYSDASIIVFDTRTGEEIGSMASLETYNGTMATSVNAVVATTSGMEQAPSSNLGDDDADSPTTGGPTGGRSSSGSGVEGLVISGHEDRFVRFFDANSGQCTYNMLAHPAAISALSLSPDGRELVSAGHDASLRFWNLEKRCCTQEISNHRIMRGEGVCDVIWSSDGRWVVSCGGDGLVRVFAR